MVLVGQLWLELALVRSVVFRKTLRRIARFTFHTEENRRLAAFLP